MMRQATESEILLLLRDREVEIRMLINEPDAVLSVPVDGWARLLATVTRPPVQHEVVLCMSIDDTVVEVPVQVTDGHEPVQCGPWLQKQQKIIELAAMIRNNDPAMCLAVEIRRRQTLEQSLIDRDARFAKLIDRLYARVAELERR